MEVQRSARRHGIDDADIEHVVALALIERLADKAERGFEHARLRRRGRPPLGATAAKVTQVRRQPDLPAALAERAERDGTAPSTVIREALREYLSR